MKAIVRDVYGPPEVLELREIEKPAPKNNEILMKVHSASVNRADSHGLRGTPFMARIILGGLRKPKTKILGYDFSGQVETVGEDVSDFKPGDEVFGTNKVAGGFAEYISVSEELMLIKPPSVSYDDAASLPGAGVTALQCLQKYGGLQAGENVLINGASGGVGTYTVQIAKAMGATVTGVCSTANLDMVRSLGANEVIDYTTTNFTQADEKYDLIVDVVAKSSFSDCKPILKPNGRYVTTAFSPGLAIKSKTARGDKKMLPMLASPVKDDLIYLRDLLESGQVKPVIDRRYPLEKVADAISYLEEGHVKGKLIINM
ncbi:MAG: NAD(P)-dependent alcohol dehydrogenase [Candidatus Thorarchaeota archaeon]